MVFLAVMSLILCVMILVAHGLESMLRKSLDAEGRCKHR